MSVDVEDYFQVQAFAHCIDRADWDRIPCRVEANVDRLLGQFDRAGVRATFFTLGWVAERYPALVRRIVAEGHELASHGMEHVRADAQAAAAFRADVARARAVLEDAGGVPVAGLPGGDVLDRAAQSVGLRRAGGGRLPLQLQRLSGASRPLWNAGGAAPAVPAAGHRACGRSR